MSRVEPSSLRRAVPEIRKAKGRTAARGASAFTLAEILVVMALLSFIVLGLMAMFNQTQRAFRTGLMETDILESGRLATDLLGREVEQIAPSYLPGGWAGSDYYPAPNFYTELQNLSAGAAAQYYTIQTLPSVAGNTWRTNAMHDVFFLTHENKTWTGIGYFARTNRPAGPYAGPVCTLYRFEMNRTDEQFAALPYQMFTNFNFARLYTNELPTVSRIIDGVVHFRVRPCDDAGWLIPLNPSWWPSSNAPSIVCSSNLFWTPNSWYTNHPYGYFRPEPYSGEFLSEVFLSNAIPAYVDIEIGILEKQTLERYQSLPMLPAAQYFTSPRYRFFTGSAAHTHLFRQRVAVRNLDPLVYQ